VRAEDVGHRVPTGFIDRHLMLVVEAADASGRPAGPVVGPRLPSAAGPGFEGKPGKLFARLLSDPAGHGPAPFWNANPEPADTRLRPGRAETFAFRLTSPVAKVRVRVIYRRFWDETRRRKGWPDEDVVLFDKQYSPGGES
jgi:hypothetical protein